jgi:enoyl-[acyl-carrier-protein] reductase (NADH)
MTVALEWHHKVVEVVANYNVMGPVKAALEAACR